MRRHVRRPGDQLGPCGRAVPGRPDHLRPCVRVSGVDRYTTGPYDSMEFEHLALLSPPYSDHGLDSDLDGEYEYLVISMQVDVVVPGYYLVGVTLCSAEWDWITQDFNFTYLHGRSPLGRGPPERLEDIRLWHRRSVLCLHHAGRWARCPWFGPPYNQCIHLRPVRALPRAVQLAPQRPRRRRRRRLALRPSGRGGERVRGLGGLRSASSGSCTAMTGTSRRHPM